MPAVTELAQVDSTGKERMRVSRIDINVLDSGIDLSKDPKFTDAVAQQGLLRARLFPPGVRALYDAVAGWHPKGRRCQHRRGQFKADPGTWSRRSRSAPRGQAYVVDAQGRLISHPDISLVLRNTDMSKLAQVQAAQAKGADTTPDALQGALNIQGQEVLTASAPIAPLGWTMFVELPVKEAYASLYQALQRLAIVLLAASIFAVLAGIFLARRMVVPIQALRAGAERIGSGDLPSGSRFGLATNWKVSPTNSTTWARGCKNPDADLEQQGRTAHRRIK